MQIYSSLTLIMIFLEPNGIQVSWFLSFLVKNPDSGFERLPDRLWNKNDTHSEHNFPILNDRLVFVRYAKINLKFMAHNMGPKKMNETTDFFFYSSNINCSNQKLERDLVPECFNTTVLRGTDINNLTGQSSRVFQN